MSCVLRFSLRLASLASGSREPYPEIEPFFVLAQLSQHVAEGYHSVHVRVEAGKLVEARLEAPLRQAASYSEASHLALTFVATSHTPEEPRRSYLVPLGEASVPLAQIQAGTYPRQLDFRDPCSLRASSRRREPNLRQVIKARASELRIELESAPLTLRPSPLSRREHEILMVNYRSDFTEMVQRARTPALEYLKWFHMPEYVTRDDVRVPAWTLLLRRPADKPCPCFYENLLQCAVELLRVTTLPTLSAQQVARAAEELLRYNNSQLRDDAAECLRLTALVGSVAALAATLFSTHTVYAVDHTNHLARGRRAERPKASRPKSSLPDYIEVVERIIELQEFGGGDCEEKAQHPYMLLQVMREQDESWSRKYRLLDSVSRYLRTYYVPALTNVSALSARASNERSEAKHAELHTPGLLLPWWFLHDTIGRTEAERRHKFALGLTADQRAMTRHAPPLMLEGTALTWPLLAPLSAYLRENTAQPRALSQSALDSLLRTDLDARTRWISDQVPELAELDTLIDVLERDGTRRDYLTSRRRMSAFYGRALHIWIEAQDGAMPWDYLVVQRESGHYGVECAQVLLGETSQFTLVPLTRKSVRGVDLTSRESAFVRSLDEALQSEVAISSLRAPAARAETAGQFPGQWNELATGLRPLENAPRRWQACFLVPVRSFERDEPPFSVSVVLKKLAKLEAFLQLERLRLTESHEWALLIVSGH